MSSVTASDEAEAQHPLLGSILRGNYRLLRLLDRDGAGTVFEGEHLRLARRLAIKVLPRHLVGDPQARARFNREAEIISQIEHPNVVQVIDFDTTESGEPYLVMEYLAGQSLRALLEGRRKLPADQLARIVYQAASGLDAAHRMSVVHRDLKPANVFLTEVASGGTLVKLLDFGISKRLGSERGITGEYELIGTPEYMSPEQALGQPALVDHRSDQYALAVIAFEAIAGALPVPEHRLADTSDRVFGHEPLALSRFAPEAPAAVDAVLRQALARDPDERFSSATEFATALLASVGVRAPSPDGPLANSGQLLIDELTALGPGKLVTMRPDGRYTSAPPLEVTSTRTLPAARAPDASSVGEVSHLVDLAREAFGLGDVDLAVSYAESALQAADRTGSSANERIAGASMLLESIFQSRLRSLGERVTRRAPVSVETSRLSPEQAFLLSRLSDHGSVEELLDLSPLGRRETLRHLVALLRRGFITLE